MADKNEMLSRIKTALGSSSALGAAERGRPTPAGAGVAASRIEELAAQFSVELEKIGGRAVQVSSEDEARAYILNLIAEKKATIVAASDPAIVNWLTEQGVEETVPALSEFAARSTGESGDDLTERYKQALMQADVGITGAEYAIADTGTLVLISGGEQHRLISLVPPVHICFLDSTRIVPDLSALISRVHAERYSSEVSGPSPRVMTFITGMSRTADIELTLTRGVHGPREVHVLLV